MQEHIIYLDAHESVAVVRDEKNMRTLPPPTLVRGTACILKLRLFAERIGTTPFPIANLYDVVSWQWAMDSDFYDRSPYKLVGDNPNSIGNIFWSYYARMYASTQTRYITIDGAAPTSKDYPLRFDICMYYDADNPKPQLHQLVEYLTSEEGKKLIEFAYQSERQVL